MVVGAIAVLLLTSLAVMFFFSRKTLKEEAMQNAEQTLEGAVKHIDIILLSVEQATGNTYFHIVDNLDKPDSMFFFCRKILESNPYICGCAVAYAPHYLPDCERFMAYVHRSSIDSTFVESTTFANRPYYEQAWYTVPIANKSPCWTEPMKDDETEGEAITSFCIPVFTDDGDPIAVIGVDVPIGLLSAIIQTAKPSLNGYTTLLGSSGSFLVHPDSNKLFHQTVFTQTEQGTDPSVREAAEAMVAGGTGYKRFYLNGRDYYVFYKPFQRTAVKGRSMEELGWSVGVIYPLDDIFGDYYQLVKTVLAVAVAGLLLLFLLSLVVAHRQLLPLRAVARSAQRIADGVYDAPIVKVSRQDEIGQLQDNFQQMQRALATQVSELEKLKDVLANHEKELREAYRQASEADRMKLAFLHNMTNQMAAPAAVIDEEVAVFCNSGNKLTHEDADRLADEIQHQAKTITMLLNQLLDTSEKDTRKEDVYE